MERPGRNNDYTAPKRGSRSPRLGERGLRRSERLGVGTPVWAKLSLPATAPFTHPAWAADPNVDLSTVTIPRTHGGNFRWAVPSNPHQADTTWVSVRRIAVA